MEIILDWKYSLDEMPKYNQQIIVFFEGCVIKGAILQIAEYREPIGLAYVFYGKKISETHFTFSKNHIWTLSLKGFYWAEPGFKFNIPNQIKRKVLTEKI
jgi:hypothetical protein